MTNWPDKPLIRVIHGRDADRPKDGVIAIRSNITGAYRGEGCSFDREYPMDSIDEWEEATAVPTAALKHLRDVFLGVELPFTQFAALQQVVSHLPTDKSSALVWLAELIEEGER